MVVARMEWLLLVRQAMRAETRQSTFDLSVTTDHQETACLETNHCYVDNKCVCLLDSSRVRALHPYEGPCFVTFICSKNSPDEAAQVPQGPKLVNWYQYQALSKAPKM